MYNYNFSKMSAKEMRYLDLSYKYDLNNEEYIEIEIKTMILFKNLRYLAIDESVLLDYEKNFKLSYETKSI